MTPSGIEAVPKALPPKVVGPPPAGGSIVAVGKAGPLAVRATEFLPIVKGTQGIPLIKRCMPWIVGPSVCWEIGRQFWEGIEHARLINTNGEKIASIADGCAALTDIFSDLSQAKTLIKDLHALKQNKGTTQNSVWLERMQSNYYGLTDEGLILVSAYQAMRDRTNTDYLFNARGHIGIVFSDIYLSWYDPSANALTLPSDQAIDDLWATLTRFYTDMTEATDIVEGGKQLIDVDTWLKYHELITRMKLQGSVEKDWEKSNPVAGIVDFDII